MGETNMVAQMLGISGRHVRRLAAKGTFHVVGVRVTGKRGRPALMFDLRQVAQAWQDQHKVSS
jgi:predicted ArsR family transcriptional regulator